MNRSIPNAVRKFLRQEAFFGCCVCGDPILDYHHIVPWSDMQHNDPEHMVALCPTHHRVVGKMARVKQYQIKSNPINKRSGRIKGLLATDKEQPAFVLGSNTFVNTPVIFSYFEFPIFKYKIVDGTGLISVYLPDENFWPELSIVDNDLMARVEGVWDLEFRTNYLKISKLNGGNYFEIDIRGDAALVSGSVNILDERFEFSPSGTSLGSGLLFKNNTFTNCKSGMSVGDGRRKIVPSNYAMKSPRPSFVPI